MFDETERMELDQVAPQVVDGKTDIKIGENSIQDYDACFVEVPVKNAVFGRVLLEMIEEKNISVNQPSTAFFIMAKKNYLYHVLHQKGIPGPRTAVMATEKAARNIEKEIQAPLIARKIEGLKQVESKKLEETGEIHGFAEGSEYEEDILIFQEYSDAEKFKCLVIGDQVISLKDSSDSWKIQDDSLKYSNLSDDQEEIVRQTAEKIGTSFAEVCLRGQEIYDMNPNPDVELYEQNAGKDVYEAVAKMLKEGE